MAIVVTFVIKNKLKNKGDNTMKLGGKNYNDDDLKDMGIEIASIYGVEFESYEIDNDEKQVVFLCDEDGEKFSCAVGFSDLGKSFV